MAGLLALPHDARVSVLTLLPLAALGRLARVSKCEISPHHLINLRLALLYFPCTCDPLPMSRARRLYLSCDAPV